MFKSSLVITILAFVLAGCGKKVTKDMLVGKWTCTTIDTHIIYYKNGNIKNEKITKYGPYILTFTKNKNILYRQYEQLKPEIFEVPSLSETGYKAMVWGTEHKKLKGHVFISDNEFDVLDNTLFRDSKSKITTEIHDVVKSCNRIKE